MCGVSTLSRHLACQRQSKPRVIAGEGLPRRAAETLVLLVGLLVLSVAVLAPQPRAAMALESCAVGVVVLAVMLRRLTLHGASTGPAYRRVVPTVILGVFAAPILAGGVCLLTEMGGGLYWFVPAVVLGFVGAVVNAWVLLVEIMR